MLVKGVLCAIYDKTICMTTTDYLTPLYRPDLDVLTARWLRQPTEVEMEAGYFSMLEVAVQHSCHYWLVDVRRREHANQQSSPWMMQQFFSLLPERLPGKKVFMAYLFQPLHLYDLVADESVPGLDYFDGRPYCVAR